LSLSEEGQGNSAKKWSKLRQLPLVRLRFSFERRKERHNIQSDKTLVTGWKQNLDGGVKKGDKRIQLLQELLVRTL
jgi:hypothetical protein